jgi:Cytochrome P460
MGTGNGNWSRLRSKASRSTSFAPSLATGRRSTPIAPTHCRSGTMLVKLAWKHIQSPEFESALVRGFATTVQVMVKDSKRYAATGGWGFGRFIDGQPADEAQHQTCFVCHKAQVKARDYVFTKFAP